MVNYSPIESEFGSSEEEAAYDAWFRAPVARALQREKPHVPHEEVMRQMSEIIAKHEHKNCLDSGRA